MNCIYLIQASKGLPELYECLRGKDYVLLSYKEQTNDTTLFFPNSTWTTGRNRLRQYALDLEKKYDYYIFLDEDVKFQDVSQEIGFTGFEQLLETYNPRMAVPNLEEFYTTIFPSRLLHTEAQTTVLFDPMLLAICSTLFSSESIFPYIDKFDNVSWLASTQLNLILCYFLKIDVTLFEKCKILNTQHSVYSKPDGSYNIQLLYTTLPNYINEHKMKIDITEWNPQNVHTRYRVVYPCLRNKTPKLSCLYLIQASKGLPELYECLRGKDYVLLSYKEQTNDTAIFFPNSTWTTGRNRLRQYALDLEKKYDYYIFLDEDVKFQGVSQEIGFTGFEQRLGKYRPYIGNPNLVGYPYGFSPTSSLVPSTTGWFDGIFNAFSLEAFQCTTIFPYIDTYDSYSWFASQFCMIMLCSIYKKEVVVFWDTRIHNMCHSDYPRNGDFRQMEKDILENIQDTTHLHLNWHHHIQKTLFPARNTKCIVITTIYTPSKQILSYTHTAGWDLIVVGDSKTNDADYKGLNCIYLGLNEQKRLFPTLYEKIPLKSYTRKMFGYLYAIQNKYDVIYDTDDDNTYTKTLDAYENNYEELSGKDVPGNDIHACKLDAYDPSIINRTMLQYKATSFTFDLRDHKLWIKHSQSQRQPHGSCISGIQRGVKTCSEKGFVNLYKVYTDKHIWPRGIPPSHASITAVPQLTETKLNMSCSIIQGLVNNDPDVDAHYRIHIQNTPFHFEKDPGYDVVLDKYSVCPFNTQNTFWVDKEMFYALYLPITVTFRYTDILHGFVALYQLWKKNKTIKFTFPTAVQERNDHDLQKDYESEIPMYQTAEEVIRLLDENRDATMFEVYQILHKHGIVQESELEVLKEWLRLIDSF